MFFNQYWNRVNRYPWLKWVSKKRNKRAMMALYRSPESHWLCKNDHDISKERDLCKVHTKQIFKTSVFQYNFCEEFYIFGQCDLVFDPKWPIFKSDLEVIKIHVRNNFHDERIKTVTSTAMTRFSMIWLSDLVFDRSWPIFKVRPRNHKKMCTTIFKMTEWKMLPLLQ